jgi:L-threonylcarbamoyladenylate synthase
MSHATPDDLPAFLTAGGNDLARTVALLRGGEVVALPTETVYGLAANALDEQAVQKIFTIKGRPLIDPLIVHGFSEEFLSHYAYFTPPARQLANACWPGPLTLVLPKKAAIPALVTAGRETVAVRVPAHPVMLAILEAARLPLAAPSANPFGYLSPTRPDHVRASLGARAPWIVDGGPCAVGLESTIVDVSDASRPPQVLRPGPITLAALAHILGQPVELAPAQAGVSAAKGLPAPGLLERHYSPRTPLALFAPGQWPAPPAAGVRVAWISLGRHHQTPPPGVELFWLSEDGNLAEAARALYDLLRRLDNSKYDKLWCETAPEAGMGLALNDRLRRAAAGTPPSSGQS